MSRVIKRPKFLTHAEWTAYKKRMRSKEPLSRTQTEEQRRRRLQYLADYRRLNRESINQKQRIKYQNNKELFKERNAKWRAENPDYIKSYVQRPEVKERNKIKMRINYSRYKEKMRRWQLQNRKNMSINARIYVKRKKTSDPVGWSLYRIMESNKSRYGDLASAVLVHNLLRKELKPKLKRIGGSYAKEINKRIAKDGIVGHATKGQRKKATTDRSKRNRKTITRNHERG